MTNNPLLAMTVTFTSRQMLQIWHSCAGLEPLSADCTIERFDGVDVDSRLSELMRQWYLALLDEGDPRLIGQPCDASSLVSLKAAAGDWSATVVCEPSVRRLCAIRLSEWHREVPVVERSEIAHLLPFQANPFSRAGVCDPIAWRNPDGSVHAIPSTASSRVTAASAVVDPGEDSFRLDTRALSTINDYLSHHFL